MISNIPVVSTSLIIVPISWRRSRIFLPRPSATKNTKTLRIEWCMQFSDGWRRDVGGRGSRLWWIALLASKRDHIIIHQTMLDNKKGRHKHLMHQCAQIGRSWNRFNAMLHCSVMKSTCTTVSAKYTTLCTDWYHYYWCDRDVTIVTVYSIKSSV